MIRVLSVLLAILAGGCVAAAGSKCSSDTPWYSKVPSQDVLVIRDVSVVTMLSSGILRSRTVVLRDGVIEAVGGPAEVEVPKSARVLDGRELYLAPGLADMHAHLGFFYGSGLPISEHELAVYLAHGVTTVLNQGDFGEPLGRKLNDLATRVREGDLAGPSLLGASYARGPGGGLPFQIVRDAKSGRDLVLRSRAAGYDFMKVYHPVSEEAFRGVVEEARRLGMPVLAHPILELSLERNLAIGIDLIAHTESYTYSFFNNEIKPERLPSAVELTQRYRPYIATTLAVEDRVLEVATGDEDTIERLLSRAEMELVHPRVKASWRKDAFSRWRDPNRSREYYFATHQFIMQIFRALHSGSGARFLLGTDGPVVVSAPGVNVHQEMERLRSLGLSSYDVMLIATVNPGSFLLETGVVDTPLGVVAVGAQADLVLLRANPLEDVSHYGAIDAVISDGRYYDRRTLDMLLSEARLFNLAGALPE